ncbi:MAG: hypothetical protein ACOCP4_01715 [Candidatus Woesearchaeota archaeon]
MDYIDEIKRLAGINEYTGYKKYETDTRTSSEKKLYEYENGIQPGTDEWFDLWFSNQIKLNNPIGFRGRKRRS